VATVLSSGRHAFQEPAWTGEREHDSLPWFELEVVLVPRGMRPVCGSSATSRSCSAMSMNHSCHMVLAVPEGPDEEGQPGNGAELGVGLAVASVRQLAHARVHHDREQDIARSQCLDG